MIKRYHSLDSLRGLAALQVVIGHCFIVIPALAWTVDFKIKTALHNTKFFITNSPLHIIWNAPAAVMVFFVLSGFVLSLPYYDVEKATPNYYRFFIKRIIRLYIPCLVIILISLLIKSIIYKPNEINVFGDWLKEMWVYKRTTKDYINLFLLERYFNDIDPALWTLPVELKLSLILPFFVYVQKRTSLLWSIALVLGCAVFYHSFKYLGLQDVWEDFAFFYYFIFFALGSLICKYRRPIISWVNRINTGWYIGLVAISIIVITYKSSLWWLPQSLNHVLDKAEQYIYGLAGGMLIIIALSKRAHVFLNSKVLMFFGRISFSIYLIHMVVITTLAYILHNVLNPAVIISIGFCVSMALAVVYYRFVELPALSLGNFVSARVIKSPVRKAGA